ncbi:MAG: hypothetical protein ACD_7C00362G0002 [uncultured bacterium]|nr:MAG: hypothetical protein ACD_7C00362G0002 [uncultured bacterium]HBR79388.1 hypothetical protein [Candidatus Moranbacteria bacterium]
MSKNKISGGKATKSHTTFIDAAEPVVKFLIKSPLVKKYSLGMIEVARSKKRRIKLANIQGGVKLVIYGNIAFQEIYVYTSSPELFRKELGDILGKEFDIQGDALKKPIMA